MNKLVYDEEAIVYVTKEFTFDSAHYLDEYYGLCSNLHGHTYRLQVTVRGILNDIGMVIDFKELKSVVKEKVIDKLDHKYINNTLPFNPTAENLVVWIYDVLREELEKRKIVLDSIKLWETPTSFAEYRGDRLALYR
ncbi:MAG: 6-carboxytetrahydropterin synthase QueD [Thermosipho sp. (in: Bacteria)]|nr:6-carboxytetrahydropterin synthase QueD [Thermosipho sp. (in: thermotogales)]